MVFTERAFRQARLRPPAALTVADAVLIDALLATCRPDLITGGLPRERFYWRRTCSVQVPLNSVRNVCRATVIATIVSPLVALHGRSGCVSLWRCRNDAAD